MSADVFGLIEEFGDTLYRYAITRVRDEATAEDLVQETLLAAINGSHSFAHGSSFGTWLTGILKHKIIDHYRRQSFLTVLSDESDLFDESGRWRDDAVPQAWNKNTPEADLENKELGLAIQRALNAIPRQLALVFTLHEVEGLSRGEICELLGLSDANYWVVLHRARLRLRVEVERRWHVRDAHSYAAPLGTVAQTA